MAVILLTLFSPNNYSHRTYKASGTSYNDVKDALVASDPTPPRLRQRTFKRPLPT